MATPSPLPDRASLLLLEECFAREDGRFLELLRRVESPKWLASFADRWKQDTRPWARAQVIAYLDLPLDCIGHQPLVKRLFKAAEERKDDELLAAFLEAFDTSLRRVRQKRFRWDSAARMAVEDEYLGAPRDALPAEPARVWQDPRNGQRIVFTKTGRRILRGRLFSHRTRKYLRRRAWRYFRRLGYARPAEYPAAIARALQRYRDTDLAAGENILDSWALLHVGYQGCDALDFTPDHVRLKPNRTLGELRAAPYFAEAWQTPAAAQLLFDLIARAPAQLVRLWAMDVYRQVRTKPGCDCPADALVPLFDHADERVQQFAAELFESHPDVDKLPVDTWLRLLGTRNPAALAVLCTAFEKRVSRARLTLPQILTLCCAAPVPVARLGRTFLFERTISPSERASLGALAGARCTAVAGELAEWALARVGTADTYEVGTVCRFLDSLVVEMREAAWTWLINGSAGYNDPVLWSRLSETPFDDLKLRLIDHLAQRVRTPKIGADQLAPVWCAVLLGVHRGGRQKLKAVREISAAIAEKPERAAQLLPVLAVAVRSVRGPERRAGLGAVMTLLAARPELADGVRARLPELEFQLTEVAA